MKRGLLEALLGFAIGLLAMLVMQQFLGRRNNLRAGDGWHKVELILKSIDENYVDSVDHRKVTDAVAAAALSALDPHSVYMLPRTLEASEEDLAGNFDGIGIQFNVPNDTAVVIEVIPGGPSEKIGLQPGDRLIKVDTTVIAGVQFPQDSMVRRMKGKAGTQVTVTVQRGDETIPFEITRGKIPTHSVDAAFMVDDTTGYIRLSKFSRTTAQEFLTSGAGLLASGMNRLILDLRNNSGGFLDQALMLSNMFLHEGDPIVYMEGLHREREDFKADGNGLLQDIKLNVLINESTASSSEILAGALQVDVKMQSVVIERRTEFERHGRGHDGAGNVRILPEQVVFLAYGPEEPRQKPVGNFHAVAVVVQILGDLAADHGKIRRMFAPFRIAQNLLKRSFLMDCRQACLILPPPEQ